MEMEMAGNGCLQLQFASPRFLVLVCVWLSLRVCVCVCVWMCVWHMFCQRFLGLSRLGHEMVYEECIMFIDRNFSIYMNMKKIQLKCVKIFIIYLFIDFSYFVSYY